MEQIWLCSMVMFNRKERKKKETQWAAWPVAPELDINLTMVFFMGVKWGNR